MGSDQPTIYEQSTNNLRTIGQKLPLVGRSSRSSFRNRARCGFSPCDEELSSANGRARARASALQGDFRVAGRLPHLHARERVAGFNAMKQMPSFG